MSDSTLIPLRIPSGWATVFNIFFHQVPRVEDGVFVNGHAFGEDLLSIEQVSVGRGEPGFILDLGWYPPEEPEGRYRLTFLYESWEQVICSVESRDPLDIRALIDHWLDVAMSCDSAEEARKQLLGQPAREKGNPLLRKAARKAMERAVVRT